MCIHAQKYILHSVDGILEVNYYFVFIPLNFASKKSLLSDCCTQFFYHLFFNCSEKSILKSQMNAIKL